MSLTTIRSFKLGDDHYRHAICLNTDAVFLQRYTDNEDATCDDDLWTTLLKYSSDCQVMQGTKRIGNFRTEGGADQWVMYEGPLRTRITFPPSRSVESLLDAEMLYSQRWLAQKGSTSARPSEDAAAPSDTPLQ